MKDFPFFRRHLPLILLVFMSGLFAIPAKALPSEDDIKDWVKDAKNANADAAATVPRTRTKQHFENQLDRELERLDDLKSAKETVDANPKATAKQKKRAADRVKAQEKKAQAAKDLADEVTTRDPDRDEAYREALERRREARAKLKKGLSELSKPMRGLGRKQVKGRVQRARRGLQGTSPYPSSLSD